MAAAPMTAASPARAAVLEPAVPATFDETLARYGAEIYRFALHLTRNRPDADDLYQETALKAYRAWDRLPCDANHRAWLYRIATNAILSNRRQRSVAAWLRFPYGGRNDFDPVWGESAVRSLVRGHSA